MSERRRRNVGRRSRLVLLGIAAILVAALAASFLLSGSGIEEAEAAAEVRAVRYAENFLFAELTPELASSDILGSEYRDLLLLVQAGVLSDDRVVRVRIWKAGGDLVFSTAQRDKIEEYVAIGHPQIGQASRGVTVSAAGVRFEPRAGLEGSGELYSTFVPLHLGDDVAPFGVVEIDQSYAAIEEAANRIWRLVQMFLILALVGFAGVAAISLRSSPGAEPAPARPRRPAREEGRRAEPEDRAQSSEDEEREAGIGRRRAEKARRKSEPEVPEVPPDVRKRLEELDLKLRAEEAERQQFAGEAQRLRVALVEKEAELAREGAAAKEAEEARSARIAELESALLDAERRAAEAAASTAREDGKKKAGAELRKAELEAKDLRLRLAEAEAATADLAAAKAAADEARATVQDAKAESRRAKEEAAAVAAEAEETKLELARALLDVDRLQEELDRVAADAERARDERSSAPAIVATANAATLDEGGAANLALEGRVADMEAQRRAEVVELQRAQESLANTQFELIEATRKLKESQERIRVLESGEARPAAPVENPKVRRPDAVRRPERDRRRVADEPEPAYVTALPGDEGRSVPAPEVSPPEVTGPAGDAPARASGGEDPEPEDEAGLSLRERLARAAAARHRPGQPS